ncbi:hypothetical protein EW145_g2100 [Phellinidium pouzarii]|uniref:ATPase AAA-type core domain-containing protein n=1 Tax=Phellinidium pouzarii TaxID=167371 RepID=A0A4V3XDE2_9AGAM|nr:hypothetical protein EW145_g2100 [Phellinidium pouzarii]
MSVPPSSTTSFATILDDHFSAATSNGEYTFLKTLKRLHAGSNTLHIALIDHALPLSAFLLALGIKVEILDEPRHELVSWSSNTGGSHPGAKLWQQTPPGSESIKRAAEDTKGGLSSRLVTGILKFRYKDTNFLVYKISWYQERSQRVMYDFVFDAPDNVVREVKDNSSIKSAGHDLVSDIYHWSQALKDEMWVFQDGHWRKDAVLWAAISGSSWDDIVLEQEFLEGLRRDTRTFFENRSIYQELGVVWKRGLLLLGPPGNGKTESIKVLLKETGQVALYVKSFNTSMGPENGSQNEGILTIATTNHPERIDDAILNRPSRFDVKYNFALPTESLRTTYALKWIRKIASLHASAGSAARKTNVKFDCDEAELAEEVAKNTEGWSFAFLKELCVTVSFNSEDTFSLIPKFWRFISFLLRLAHDKARDIASGHSNPNVASADSVLLEQIISLSSQILNVDDKSNEAISRGMPVDSVASGRRVVRAMAATPLKPPDAHHGTNF